MLTVHMPLDFQIGETRDVEINGASKRVTWRDPETLVIPPNDVRIFHIEVEDDLRRFVCGDMRARRLVIYHEGDGVIVSDDPSLTIVDR
jgi:hypothetical protein